MNLYQQLVRGAVALILGLMLVGFELAHGLTDGVTCADHAPPSVAAAAPGAHCPR